MTPLDSNAYVTAWIPLRPISGTDSDSGMLFAVNSHRDFALPFWHDLRERDLSDRGYAIAGTGPMQLGDVSWHHGWTVHSAGKTAIAIGLTVPCLDDGHRQCTDTIISLLSITIWKARCARSVAISQTLHVNAMTKLLARGN